MYNLESLIVRVFQTKDEKKSLGREEKSKELLNWRYQVYNHSQVLVKISSNKSRIAQWWVIEKNVSLYKISTISIIVRDHLWDRAI